MPIKWSALKVSEAADMIEGYVNQAAEPLECAREIAKAALEIPNLPNYVSDDFWYLIAEINRAIGGGYEGQGRLKLRLKSIRDELPKDALESEQKRKEIGEQKSLV
ncbi:MAG: hypothetical protein ACUVTR_02125 [Dehalococcoidia bacterium]